MREFSIKVIQAVGITIPITIAVGVGLQLWKSIYEKLHHTEPPVPRIKARR